MADYFRCRACEARLIGLTELSADRLGPCPHCGERDWDAVVELGGSAAAVFSVSGELAVAPGGSAIVRPRPIETKSEFPTPTIRVTPPDPAMELPTDEELDRLGIHSDFVALGLLLHAPGKGDPDDGFIVEMMRDGEWDHLYRIGVVPDDAILDAADDFADYVKRWWAAIRYNRGDTN